MLGEPGGERALLAGGFQPGSLACSLKLTITQAVKVAWRGGDCTFFARTIPAAAAFAAAASAAAASVAADSIAAARVCVACLLALACVPPASILVSEDVAGGVSSAAPISVFSGDNLGGTQRGQPSGTEGAHPTRQHGDG